jgi:23S rRNA pseudouridine1911/1915/1917 synthase
LARQFKRKSVHRIYWAVVYGTMNKKRGTITSYIRRSPSDRKKFASEVVRGSAEPTGKLAITHYDVKKEISSGLSLVHLQLETGRTHQIRVHMSESGHPIVSDPFYCNSHRMKSVKSVHVRELLQHVPHLILHAAELGFIHPKDGKEYRFLAPWPDELKSFMKELEFEPL